MLASTKNTNTFENANHTIELKAIRTGIVGRNDKVRWETYFTINTSTFGELGPMTEATLRDLYDLITEYYQHDKQPK